MRHFTLQQRQKQRSYQLTSGNCEYKSSTAWSYGLQAASSRLKRIFTALWTVHVRWPNDHKKFSSILTVFIFLLGSIKNMYYPVLSFREGYKDMTDQEQCCLPLPLEYQMFQVDKNTCLCVWYSCASVEGVCGRNAIWIYAAKMERDDKIKVGKWEKNPVEFLFISSPSLTSVLGAVVLERSSKV